MCAGNCGNCDTCAPDSQPGRRGPRGYAGPANTLTFAVSILPAGDAATVDVTGVSPNQAVSLGIPAAPSPVIAALVNTLAAGLNATVSVNNTNPLAPIITFGIPRGANGDDGWGTAFTTLDSFNMPAAGSTTAPVTIGDNRMVQQGTWVKSQGFGGSWFVVTSVIGDDQITLRNPGSADLIPYWGSTATSIPTNAAPTTPFAVGTNFVVVGAPGLIGPAATPVSISVDTVTTIPVAAPAAGGELVVYTDSLLTPTIVAFYAWDGAAWNPSPNLIGPAGTLWQTSNGDPNSTLPSGPIGTFVLRTDVLSIYQRTGPATWNLIGSLTPTFDQVWTQSNGLTTRPQYYTADVETHASDAAPFVIDLTRVLTVVDVQDDIELDYSTLSNYGEWWLELENSTGSSVAVSYATGKWEKNTGSTEVTSLAASGSPGDRVVLHMIASKGSLVVAEFITPVAI
jgi:hypothetical protein